MKRGSQEWDVISGTKIPERFHRFVFLGIILEDYFEYTHKKGTLSKNKVGVAKWFSALCRGTLCHGFEPHQCSWIPVLQVQR